MKKHILENQRRLEDVIFFNFFCIVSILDDFHNWNFRSRIQSWTLATDRNISYQNLDISWQKMGTIQLLKSTYFEA